MRFLLYIFLFFSYLTVQANDWVEFNKGMDKAKKEKKHVLIDFYTDWCHWCKVMDEKTFQDKDVAEKLKDFVAIRIDAENKNKTVSYQNKQYTNVELTKEFGIRGFPSLVFMNSKGELITLIPGYVPADKFVQVLEYIDQTCYEKDISFKEFLEKGDCKSSKK